MDVETLKQLCGAYDMEVQFERPEEHKIRFRGNGTFMDLWCGKKGLTVGVYDKSSSTMHFTRGLVPTRLEDILINIKEKYED